MQQQNFKRLRYWLPLIGAILFTAGMWIGYYLTMHRNESVSERKLQELYSLIKDHYVDTVDMDSLIEMSIPAILSNLDPHSAYIPAKDLEAANLSLRGSFGGVGIQFQIYRDTLNVVAVTPGGPSEAAGLMPGDRIIAVDGKEISGKSLTDEKVREMLRGRKGSEVKLTVKRPGTTKEKMDYSIIRNEIPLESVDAAFMADNHTGYIKVSSFGESTYGEFLQALNALRVKGADSYIIDLRGNTGGYMETAILMVNEFLERGKTIVSTRGRDPRRDDIVLSDGNGAFTKAALTVLIDEISASSSEIFSGAIQDNDRGLVLGRRSFGKGLVQMPINFDDGSQVRLTVQRYYTPSGRSIQKEYKPGQTDDYMLEIFERYRNGEVMNADSIKVHSDLLFHTETGRPVYGGGGIVPDIFVPNDTTGITGYYRDAVNKGLLMDFAYEYTDLNRKALSESKDVESLLKQLPSDDILLSSFVYYATTKGVPARWYYIKLSRNLIVTQLKALIARNIFGFPAYWQVEATSDNNVVRALDEINAGNAAFPIQEKKQ